MEMFKKNLEEERNQKVHEERKMEMAQVTQMLILLSLATVCHQKASTPLNLVDSNHLELKARVTLLSVSKIQMTPLAAIESFFCRSQL
jgi:hypothetical protein